MSEVPEVFDVFEKKLAQVLSFTLVTHPNSTKKAVEELLTYFSSVVERASKSESRIAELEAAQRWIPVSERLPKESGWYLACLIGWAGGYYTGEVHFDTETGLPWRSSVRDEVYCWLDGVPEMPKPPEVQE